MLKSLVSSYKNYFHGNGNVSNSTFDRSYYLQTTRFPMWSDRSYYSFALDGYIKNVVANRCISLISKSAANTKFVLFKISSDGSKKEITKHNLIDILNNPNPTFNYQSFMENIIANLLLSGNSYVYGIKDSNFNLSEMFTLRPDRVKVISGFNSGIPSGYKYTVENVSMDFTCDENKFLFYQFIFGS